MSKIKQTVSDFIDGIKIDMSGGSNSDSYVPDIITFVEGKEWLGIPHHPSNPINLFPMQKIMLKLFYRGSIGNENLELTEEEIQLLKDFNLNDDDNGNVIDKYYSNQIFRELVLVWGRRCISEDSILTDPQDGSINKIGELYDDGIKNIDSWTYDEEKNKMVVVKDAEIIFQGTRECYELTSNAGNKIECTDNHPFLTQRGWVELKDLDVKRDQVAIIEEIPFFGNSDKVNEQDVYREDKPFSFFKIKSIRSIGRKRTFDLSVSHKKSLQNFVSQGFIVHNSGKDYCVSIIALYEAMKLLECNGGDPYAMYELSSANTINILIVANSKSQANIAFSEIREKIFHSEYFRDKYIKDGIGAGAIYLLTPKDKKENKEFKDKGLPQKKGSIGIIVGHSNSDSLLGMGCIVLILDEVASYKTTGGSSSGDRIYAALTPTVQTYVRKEYEKDEQGEYLLNEHGQRIINKRTYDGKIISISSPRAKEGKFYELFSTGKEVPTRLTMRLPTWKVNPHHTRSSLRKDNNTMSEAEFNMEFGAEFSGTGLESFFTEEQVKNCFIGHNLKNVEMGSPGRVYFVHLDPATSSHNYALVVLHKEYFLNITTQKADFRIIVDHIKFWQPIKGPINPNEVTQYVVGLKRKFHIGLITYDSWASQESILAMRKAGIPNKETKFTSSYKFKIYKELENLVNSHRILIPYHQVLYNEMVELQRKFTPSGFKVQPKKDGDGQKTDDIVDSVAGASYVAIEKQTMSLPTARLVPMGNPGNNNIVWRNMQGGIYGVGPGQMVAKALERRASWPNYKRK